MILLMAILCAQQILFPLRPLLYPVRDFFDNFFENYLKLKDLI